MTTLRPPVVTLLGYGGLLPFLLPLGAMVLDSHHSPMWLELQQGYGAVILSFVGALHWGVAMHLDENHPQRNSIYVWSVMPALLAWAATQVFSWVAAPILVTGFVLHYLRDRQLVRDAVLPPWYLPLRLQLTVVASLALTGGVPLELI